MRFVIAQPWHLDFFDVQKGNCGMQDPISRIVEEIQQRLEGVQPRIMDGETYKDAVIRMALMEYLEGPMTEGQMYLNWCPE